jgi:diguanylate cyclase
MKLLREKTPPPRGATDEGDRHTDRRDHASDDRDNAAEARDERAEARDERAEARDERAEARDPASLDAAAAARSDRAEARIDRVASAGQRAESAADRGASWSDRDMSAAERRSQAIDELTQTWRRGAGEVALEREIARARRVGETFSLVYIDVDGLKATNDELGHAAGDDLLRQTAAAILARFRPYDLLVRFGGDEFVGGLLNLTALEAEQRFVLVNEDLSSYDHASVTAGIAELGPDDTLEDLVNRADQAMYAERRRRGAGRTP